MREPCIALNRPQRWRSVPSFDVVICAQRCREAQQNPAISWVLTVHRAAPAVGARVAMVVHDARWPKQPLGAEHRHPIVGDLVEIDARRVVLAPRLLDPFRVIIVPPTHRHDANAGVFERRVCMVDWVAPGCQIVMPEVPVHTILAGNGKRIWARFQR